MEINRVSMIGEFINGVYGEMSIEERKILVSKMVKWCEARICEFPMDEEEMH